MSALPISSASLSFHLPIRRPSAPRLRCRGTERDGAVVQRAYITAPYIVSRGAACGKKRLPVLQHVICAVCASDDVKPDDQPPLPSTQHREREKQPEKERKKKKQKSPLRLRHLSRPPIRRPRTVRLCTALLHIVHLDPYP